MDLLPLIPSGNLLTHLPQVNLDWSILLCVTFFQGIYLLVISSIQLFRHAMLSFLKGVE